MKLKVRNVQYKVDKNERKVSCEVIMDIISGRKIMDTPDIYTVIEDDEVRKYTSSGCLVFDGSAVCNKDDQWDEEKGKRIAFAKAMRQTVAFRRVICNRCLDIILNAAKRAGDVEAKVNKSKVFMDKDVEYLRHEI